MITVDLIQGSPEWFAEKLGKPSASNVSKIIKNDGKPSDQRKGYLYELAAERITGKQEDTYKNGFMEMGNEREEESRKLFELTHEVEVQNVGVVYQDDRKLWLCSPDGLIKGKQGLELKNVLGKTQVKRLLDGDLPSEYFGQVQMSLMITGFKTWRFFSYCPAMKPLNIEVKRDEVYIKALTVELEKFCKELAETTEKIR